MIPNQYHIILVTLLSLSSFSLAKNIYARCYRTNISFMAINLWIKAGIVCYGLSIIPLSSLFSGVLWKEILALLVGIPLGCFYIYLEKSLSRFFSRKNPVLQRPYSTKKLTYNIKSLGLMSQLSEKLNLLVDHKAREIGASDIMNASLGTLLLIGVAEEIIYRGFLTFTIENLSISFIKIPGLLCIAFLFAFTHAPYHFSQMLCKFLFSLLTLVSFLILGTLTTAIVMHVYLNSAAWVYQKAGGLRPASRG